MSQVLEEALRVRQDTESAMEDLRAECGLNETSNMKQCLRVLLQRLSASPQIQSIGIQNQQGVISDYTYLYKKKINYELFFTNNTFYIIKNIY